MLGIFRKLLIRWVRSREVKVRLPDEKVRPCVATKEDRPGKNKDVDRQREHDLEHRALVYLMTQKTDAILAALTATLERERQKLGVVVRKTSAEEARLPLREPDAAFVDDPGSVYDKIMPLVQQGATVSTIARKLAVTESEIAMVMRLNGV